VPLDADVSEGVFRCRAMPVGLTGWNDYEVARLDYVFAVRPPPMSRMTEYTDTGRPNEHYCNAFGNREDDLHLVKRIVGMTNATKLHSPSTSQLAFGDGTPKKALLTALVVGSILTAINHGDTILMGNWPPVLKVFLTYCTPYCVTTWGAITGKRAQLNRNIAGQI